MIARSGELTRMDIINSLIKKNNYKSYLEIGCQNNVCFDKIECDFKIGVDPEKGGTHRMTSDSYFIQNYGSDFEQYKQTFDIIFVDGLHIKEQVYKDIINGLKILNKGGIILCHDILPSSYEAQLPERQTKHWNGNCWEAFVILRIERNDLEMRVIQTDCGVGIIRKGEQQTLDIDLSQYKNNAEFYKAFEENQKEWLNAIDCDTFKQLYL